LYAKPLERLLQPLHASKLDMLISAVCTPKGGQKP
jgi:hypothetical protein